MLPELGRRVDGDDAALVDDGDPVAEHLHLRQDVGGEQDGRRAAQRLDELAGLPDLVGVEPDGRLIEDEDRRLRDEAVGQRHPLPVPLGEPPDELARHVREGALLKRRPHPLAPSPARDPLEAGAVVQVLLHAQLRVERDVLRQVADAPAHLERALGDVQPVDPDRAGGGREHPRQDPQGGRLAGPVWTQKSHDLTRLDLEGDVGEGGEGVVALGEVRDFNGGRHGGKASPPTIVSTAPMLVKGRCFR
jgi:hypothetical protein